jgi:nitric oxide reductase subunit B
MSEPRRPMLLSRRWMQVALLVFLAGFLGLGIIGYLNYTGEPPMPAKVVDSSGATLFTKADVIAGQKVFLGNGLMEYGSIFGHGAYLGPDYTADYLHREIQDMHGTYAASISSAPSVAVGGAIDAQVKHDLKTNTYD